MDVGRLICESMQRHCAMYKASDGKWYMELADHEYADYEEANTYGPFSSQEQAMDYLDNFSNPGGWSEDDSGKRQPPTKSPNGSPVQSPRARNRYGYGIGGLGNFGFSGGYNTPRQREPEYVTPAAPKPSPAATAAYSTSSAARDVARRIALKKEKKAAAEKAASSTAAPKAPPAGAGKKTTYKIYGAHHDANLGSSSIHTRIKGRVYAPTAATKFKKGDSAEIAPEGEKKLRVKKPDSDHTQTWSAKESVERVILDMIELLDS